MLKKAQKELKGEAKWAFDKTLADKFVDNQHPWQSSNEAGLPELWKRKKIAECGNHGNS